MISENRRCSHVTIKPIAYAEGRDGGSYRASMTRVLGTEDEVMRVEQAQRAFEIKRLSMKQTIKPIA